jgi:mersacidin/lichenicidin family type 2 lantibiotic
MKKNIDVARAWRDEDYYLSLTEEERASLGDHPAGVVDVADEALASLSGGCGPVKGTYHVTYCYYPSTGEVFYCW